jgi:hypothetical protein
MKAAILATAVIAVGLLASWYLDGRKPPKAAIQDQEDPPPFALEAVRIDKVYHNVPGQPYRQGVTLEGEDVEQLMKLVKVTGFWRAHPGLMTDWRLIFVAKDGRRLEAQFVEPT